MFVRQSVELTNLIYFCFSALLNMQYFTFFVWFLLGFHCDNKLCVSVYVCV